MSSEKMTFVTERLEALKSQFKEEPCAMLHEMHLDFLDMFNAETLMPVGKNACTVGGIVQGGVTAALADYACVYVAMMQSENFTPLSSLHLDYLRPVILGKDKVIRACANLADAVGRKVIINVRVINENGELKATGYLAFARKKSKK